jgi:hypothetical protein
MLRLALPFIQRQFRGDEGTNGSEANVRMIRLIRLLKLIKMLRLLKSSRIIQRWECELAIPYAQIAMGKILLILLMIAHWMTCIWGFVATAQEKDDGRESFTWVQSFAAAQLKDVQNYDTRDKCQCNCTRAYWSSSLNLEVTVSVGCALPQI